MVGIGTAVAQDDPVEVPVILLPGMSKLTPPEGFSGIISGQPVLSLILSPADSQRREP
jgi:hypothetical protein